MKGKKRTGKVRLRSYLLNFFWGNRSLYFRSVQKDIERRQSKNLKKQRKEVFKKKQKKNQTEFGFNWNLLLLLFFFVFFVLQPPLLDGKKTSQFWQVRGKKVAGGKLGSEGWKQVSGTKDQWITYTARITHSHNYLWGKKKKFKTNRNWKSYVLSLTYSGLLSESNHAGILVKFQAKFINFRKSVPWILFQMKIAQDRKRENLGSF